MYNLTFSFIKANIIVWFEVMAVGRLVKYVLTDLIPVGLRYTVQQNLPILMNTWKTDQRLVLKMAKT